MDDVPPPPPPAGGPPPEPRGSPRPRSPDHDRRTRSRDHERNGGDRRRRDDFEDSPRYGRNRRRDDEFHSPPPPRRGSLRKNSPPPFKRPSPTYEPPPQEDYNPDEPKEDDSEARSVFVSQLAARLTARDLGYFFEDKLGEGTVMDARIVTDRLSRRSKGIGYVEFRTIELVEKALSLSGTVVMGLPIMVQLTEAERNRLHPGDGRRLTCSRYKRAEDAKMALEQMEGFELAGRTLRVNTVHEKGTAKYTQQDTLDESGGGNLNAASRQALMQKLARIEPAPLLLQSFRPPEEHVRSRRVSTFPSAMLTYTQSCCRETERDWDKDLAEDVKGECEEKYGKVEAIKVEKETQSTKLSPKGEIYVKFDSIDSAKNAIQGLNGRWFGGKQVSATFISDAIMQAHQ
ncbi:splicing factor CC1 protein [Salix suchowensis]|nr:splicing factor CC1 protein [Salix suchowensis]